AADEDDAVHITALQLYQPYKNIEKDKQELKQILGHFRKKPPTTRLTDALETFLSKFPDNHAEFLLEWLRENYESPFVGSAKDVLAGLTRLQPSTRDDPHVLRTFIEYAVDQDSSKSLWGVEGLQQLARRSFSLKAGAKARHEALQKLL